jgi:hypothetical protein
MSKQSETSLKSIVQKYQSIGCGGARRTLLGEVDFIELTLDQGKTWISEAEAVKALASMASKKREAMGLTFCGMKAPPAKPSAAWNLFLQKPKKEMGSLCERESEDEKFLIPSNILKMFGYSDVEITTGKADDSDLPQWLLQATAASSKDDTETSL